MILLAIGKFVPEMHLRKPESIYSESKNLSKNQEKIQNFKEIGDSRFIYEKGLHKACFNITLLKNM